jgi:hypothetical protein
MKKNSILFNLKESYTNIRRRYEMKFLQTSKSIIQQFILITIADALAKAMPTLIIKIE